MNSRGEQAIEISRHRTVKHTTRRESLQQGGERLRMVNRMIYTAQAARSRYGCRLGCSGVYTTRGAETLLGSVCSLTHRLPSRLHFNAAPRKVQC